MIELTEAMLDAAAVGVAGVVDEGTALALSSVVVARTVARSGGVLLGVGKEDCVVSLLLGDKRLLVDGGEVKLAAELNDELGVSERVGKIEAEGMGECERVPDMEIKEVALSDVVEVGMTPKAVGLGEEEAE